MKEKYLQDGHKYIRSKITEKYVYLKCALFRHNDCKGTSRLNRETDLITPLTQNYHSNEDYQSNIFDLKTKCKTLAKHTQMNLRKLFDDATRTDPSAHDISFAECEAAMYRARRTSQPKIPQSASEFSEMVSSIPLGVYHKLTVTRNGQIGVFFFSDQMSLKLLIYSLKAIRNDDCRRIHKQKLREGNFTPMEYVRQNIYVLYRYLPFKRFRIF